MKKNLLNRWMTGVAHSQPVKLLLWGYGFYIFISWLLLCLPISWKTNFVSPLDNLFIATSAVSTTGLVTVNTPEAYNFFGQLIIMCAFQIGGLGYMTLGSFVLIATKDNLPFLHRRVGRSVFALPRGFNLKTLLKHTVIFTLIIETIGAVALYYCFHKAGTENAFWAAIFHSISAFCTAGFSIFPNSLEDFRGDFWINLIVSCLSILGAIGFLVISDIWQSSTGRKRGITFTTRIILYVTSLLIGMGFILLFLFDSSLQDVSLGERILAAWFQSVTALTTVGFNTHPIGVLSSIGVLLIIILMIVGASPSGTGGGLKSTSIFAGLAVMWSSLRGNKNIALLGRRIPHDRLFTAFASFVFYIIAFLVGSSFLLMSQTQAFEDVLFEAASALGTVGLSRGITSELTEFSKLIVIVLMFVGRVGALSFGIALFTSQSTTEVLEVEEDLAI